MVKEGGVVGEEGHLVVEEGGVTWENKIMIKRGVSK